MRGRVLGIDGGGTKTEAAVVIDTGQVVWRQRAGGLDPIDGAGWEANLSALAAEAGKVSFAVLGLPCHGEISGITKRQSQLATRLFGAANRVVNDVEAAFEGALAGADGVLVLAGTGSMAWARGPLGTSRVGGWGELFGDEGSAFWIGQAALAQISRELDRRLPDSGFAQAMLKWMGIAEEELSAWAYQAPRRSRIAALAEGVSALSQSGHVKARRLMQSAGIQLAELGQTAARRCGVHDRWSFAGGVMADPTVLHTLTVAMRHPPTPPILPPVGGAVLAAAKAAGWATSGAFLDRLRQEFH